MADEIPYASIVEDAMRGMDVAVFCDTMAALERTRKEISIAAKARAMGASHVVARRTKRVIEIEHGSVYLLMPNGYDERGLSVDAVYLDELARWQFEHAKAVGAVVRQPSIVTSSGRLLAG